MVLFTSPQREQGCLNTRAEWRGPRKKDLALLPLGHPSGYLASGRAVLVIKKVGDERCVCLRKRISRRRVPGRLSGNSARDSTR